MTSRYVIHIHIGDQHDITPPSASLTSAVAAARRMARCWVKSKAITNDQYLAWSQSMSQQIAAIKENKRQIASKQHTTDSVPTYRTNDYYRQWRNRRK